MSDKAIANLDQVGIMDYDLDFADHANMTRAKADMDAWAAHLTGDLGQPASKLLFGVPFYGKAGKTWNDGESENLSYATLIDAYHNGKAGITADTVKAQLSSTLPQGFQQVWHFDNVADVQAKTQYAIDKGFGGVMAWSIGQDHLTGANVNADVDSLLAAIGRTVRATFSNNGTPTPTPTPTPTSTSGIGDIAGRVFYDGNQNHVQDEYEPGIEGAEVFLDTNDNGVLDNGERSLMTDGDGDYRFHDLPVGSYNVRVKKTSWYFVTNANASERVTVRADATTDVLFGECATYRHVFA